MATQQTKPHWHVDTLGPAGFPFEAYEDYAVPPEESYGVLFSPDRAKKGYHVEELSDGVYWLTSGWYDCMFVVTGSGVLMVDAPPALGERILDAVAEVTDEPVTHFIYSHWHADHTGASSVFGKDVVRIGHERTRDYLQRFPDHDRPAPDEAFATDTTLDVGGVKLELSYKGQDHADGNIFIYAPKQKVLMKVDIISPGWCAFKDCDSSENMSGFVQAHDQILEYDFEKIVCGHVSSYGTREDAETAREYTQDLVRFSKDALETVPIDYFLKETGDGAYKGAFRAAEENYFAGVCNYAVQKLLERKTSNGQTWTERLNGADVMSKNNIFFVAEKMRLEQNHIGYMHRDGPPEKYYG